MNSGRCIVRRLSCVCSKARLGKATWIFEQRLFFNLDVRPVRVMTALDILTVLRKMEERCTVETARRAKRRSGTRSQRVEPRTILQQACVVP